MNVRQQLEGSKGTECDAHEGPATGFVIVIAEAVAASLSSRVVCLIQHGWIRFLSIP